VTLLSLLFGAGFLGIESFNPPWDVVFLPLFNALIGLYDLLFDDLALAIVVLTILIRTLLAPLFVRQIRSQKEMQRMAPLIREVQRKHKGNPRKAQQEAQALYREHGVNQFGGCLPTILQLPILFALYQALIRASSIVTYEAPEGQKADFAQFLAVNPDIVPIQPVITTHQYTIPFDGSCAVPSDFHMFLPLNCQLITPFKLTEPVDTTVAWLGGLNLATVDSVFSIPVLGFAISFLAITAGILQFIQVKMTTPRNAGDDPTAGVTQSMVYLFPVMTVVWGAIFPSGLVLYWVVYTTYLIIQQYLIMGWGNLFPIFGWQPRWAPTADTGVVTKPRADEGGDQSSTDAGAAARPGTPGAERPRGNTKRRRRREGRKR